MIYLHFQCSCCQCVSTISEHRCRSGQNLIRPSQVEHLINRFPGIPSHHFRPAAEQTAQWLKENFASGGLAYFPDPWNCDRWCPPAETLLRRGGDCDDLALLGVSMLLAMGSPAHLVVGRSCDGLNCSGHVWIEGVDDRGFFLLEATNGQLFRGFRPQGYQPQLYIGPDYCQRVA